MTKILEVLGSIRFQQLLVATVVEILGFYGVIPSELAHYIAGLFGFSVIVGTADKINKK